MPALCHVVFQFLTVLKMANFVVLNKREMEVRRIEIALVTIRYTHT